MIDRSFTNVTLPDVRVAEVATSLIVREGDFDETIEALERTMMFTAIKGDYRLETVERTFEVLEGTAVGFQIGRKHRWIGTRSAARATIRSRAPPQPR